MTAEKLAAAQVGLIVHRTPRRSAFLNTLIAAERFSGCCEVLNIPVASYDALRMQLDGASPTSGLVCADVFLRAPIRELAIVGFTFSTTAYLDGYDDTVSSDEGARCRIEEKGHHAPQREAQLLARRINEARGAGKHVVLGRNMIAAMSRLGGGLEGVG